MHYAAEPWAELAPREVWHFRNGRLRQDSGNRLASVRNVNFADFRGFADPLARIVVELADADCFHVTHRVTSLQICQLVPARNGLQYRGLSASLRF